MTMDGHGLHRRKSSKEGDENMIVVTHPIPLAELNNVPLIAAPPPPRNRDRVQSTPIHLKPAHSRSVSYVGLPTSPLSGASLRNGYNFPRSSNGVNGHAPSPFRPSFAAPNLALPGHSRTRSISAFSQSVYSPSASSFPPKTPVTSAIYHPFPSPIDTSHLTSNSSQQPRRHQRLHSRNLSTFFARPGSIPPSSISEGGSLDVEVRVDEEAPIDIIPSASSNISFPNSHPTGLVTPLGANFTFGARPPSTGGPAPDLMKGRTPTTSMSRRGHHHKHSMSHNFFSFLEPGVNAHLLSEKELHTQPAPLPVSSWAPIPAFPQSGKPTSSSFLVQERVGNSSHEVHQTEHKSLHDNDLDTESPPGTLAVGFLQFVLGAWLWVSGQQTGSLSVTGLGYWVVFDAFGVGMRSFLPQYLKLRPSKSETVGERGWRRSRRSYGNAPVETVLMFAQAVYLMFSSVYVCKETVEHILLSGGGEEGHHHHFGDEGEGFVGIDFPIILAFITLLSITWTSLIYDNHAKLVNIAGNRVPSLRAIIHSFSSSRTPFHDSPPTSSLGIMISNPFTSSPLFFCSAILVVALFIPAPQHKTFDLVLAGIIAIVTFKVAYRACAILGTVLLQTAPARGSSSGKMEAFLRAMREVERHPQVIHLPAPHIWQLSPSSSLSLPAARLKGTRVPAVESLVVTMELHVRHDLGDDDVLSLTKWAWERCASALGTGKLRSGASGPEVTVGVVRG